MNVYDLLLSAATAHRHKAAIVFQEQTITYGELLEEVDRLAAGFASLGMRPGDRTLVHAQNRPEILTAYFAAGKLGGVMVPVNPALKPEEIQYVLQHAAPRFAMTETDQAPALLTAIDGDVRPLIIYLDGAPLPAEALMTRGYADLLATNEPSPPSTIGGDENMLIIYTSGSTGRPKAVVASHRNEVDSAHAYARVWGITAEDRVVIALPLAFLYGLTTAAVTALGAGATIYLQQRFHPAETIAALQRSSATLFQGVPTMYSMMLSYAEEIGLTPTLGSLRLCLSAGAPLHEEIRKRFSHRFSIEVIDFYALTEIRPVFAYDYARFRQRRPGSCGHRLPGVDVKLVDESGREVSRGEGGELLAKSSTLFKEYAQDPVATASALKDGWFVTGDLAKEDEDGFFYIVGRKKELIIRGGINVAPAEVEAALLKHPAVAEAAVVGAPDPIFGEKIWAFVRWQVDSAATVDDLKRFCLVHLASFKVPDAIEPLNDFPKGPTGKVLRSVIAERARAIAPVSHTAPKE